MKEKEKESYKGQSVKLDDKFCLELKVEGKTISINLCEYDKLNIYAAKNASKISLELCASSSESAQTTTSDKFRENFKSDNITQSHSETSDCSISKQSTELTQTFSTRAENINTVTTDVHEVIPREKETDAELELDHSPKWLCAANRRLGTGITHQMSSKADDLALLAATLYLICLWIEQLWFKQMIAKLLRCIPQKDKKEYFFFPAVEAFPESFFSLRETIKNVAATTGNMICCITTFDVLLTDTFVNNHSYYVDALRLKSIETQMEGGLLTIQDSLKLSEENMVSAKKPGNESYVSGFKTASCARIPSHTSEHDTGLNIPSPRESVAPSLVTTLTQKGLKIKSTNGERLHSSDRKSSSELKATDRQPADTETQLTTKSDVGKKITADGSPSLSTTQHDEGELDKYDKFQTLEKHFTEKDKAAQVRDCLQTEEVDNFSVPLPFTSESGTINKHASLLDITRHETEGSNNSSFSLQSASKSQNTGLQTEADEVDSEALTNDRDILNYAPDENENSRRKDQIKSTSFAETPVRDNNKHFGSGEPKRDVCKKGTTITSRTKSRRVASYRILVTRKVPRFHPRPYRKSTSTASLTRQSVGQEWKRCTKLPHNKQRKCGKKNELYSGSASDEQRWDSKIAVEQTYTGSVWSKTLQPLWRQHLRRVHCMRRQIGKWKGRKMPPDVIGVLLEVISMRPSGQERWLPIPDSKRTFTTSGSESNPSLESEIFPTAAWRPFSSPISAASDHSRSQDIGQDGQNAAQKGPNPHGHNKQKCCQETSVTNTGDKDYFLSATDGNKRRHWLNNQSSSKSTGCLNSEIIQIPPTPIAAHVLQGQITGNKEVSATSKSAPDVARHSAAPEGQVQDDQKPASSSKCIPDNPSPAQSKTSPTTPTSGTVTAVNGVDVATENPQTAGNDARGEKISEQTSQNDQARDSNTKRGTTSSASVKSYSISIAALLEYAGCRMEIIKLKEEIIYELRIGSSYFPLKTIYGLALWCFPDKNQWEIDRLTDRDNTVTTITSRETSVRNVLTEMKAHGLKLGHLVQYFSQEDSKRVDILQLIDKLYPTFEHCSYVDTN